MDLVRAFLPASLTGFLESGARESGSFGCFKYEQDHEYELGENSNPRFNVSAGAQPGGLEFPLE